MNVFCVLRSGGTFGAPHVERLRDQLHRAMPGAQLVCLSDLPHGIEGVRSFPLKHTWPGWWAKMELFRPGLTGDIVYLDLDVSVVGGIGGLARLGRIALMRDVYRPGGLQSAVMVLPEASRDEVWRAWIADPEGWMRRYRMGGDQAFLERFWLDRAVRLQDALPGQIVSYKADLRGRRPGPDVRLVVFHGRPRPWDVPEWVEFERTMNVAV